MYDKFFLAIIIRYREKLVLPCLIASTKNYKLLYCHITFKTPIFIFTHVQQYSVQSIRNATEKVNFHWHNFWKMCVNQMPFLHLGFWTMCNQQFKSQGNRWENFTIFLYDLLFILKHLEFLPLHWKPEGMKAIDKNFNDEM